MFSHVMVGTNDLEASRKFYDAVLSTLGIPAGVFNNGTRYFYRTPTINKKNGAMRSVGVIPFHFECCSGAKT